MGTWDIRRYSSTQIAIKVIAGAPVQPSTGPDEPDRTAADRSRRG